ncbi:uncharacterized protein LOC142608651 [Castanea sativa]|uniref:uncharacterized protein LOC142608651 n=1 Tax=Castanea sativa TaxID=21020 RepID=UPI003F64991F
MMDSNFVVSEIVGKLRQNHIARIDELRGHIDTKNNHQLAYYKVCDAKQKTIVKIFGDWEEFYQRLRKLLLAYLDQDLGTQYTYWTIPSPIDGTTLLCYVFWAFAPCIAAFRYCRPVIRHVIPDEDICIISERHKGIKCAIAEWPIGDDGKLRDVEINALRSVDPDDPHLEHYMPYTYLMSEDVEKWTQSHDSGRRYGAMTTNISECFNGVLKGACGLPIAAMVEFTWCKLVAYFHDRHKEITSDCSQGKVWSDYAMRIHTTNLQKTSGHTVREFNHETSVYQVVTPYNDHRGGGGNHSHEVRVFARTCGCAKWQNIKIPCSHAIKVLQQLHLNATSYIDPCYSLENAIQTIQNKGSLTLYNFPTKKII